MTTTKSGIATRYRDGRFRSRLEARWAALFDLVDWSWTYEPLDADGWIPDFLVAGPAPFLVEVGPCILLSEFSEKAQKALAAFPADDGQTPSRLTLVLGVGPYALGDDTAGYLTDDGLGTGTDIARWVYCSQCQHLAVAHNSGDRTLRPCGHPYPPHWFLPPSERHLQDLWQRAGATVQWQPRRRRVA